MKRRRDIDHDFTIHFKKPIGWSDTIFVHYFEQRPGGLGTPWPGLPMSSEGNRWFVHHLFGINPTTIVFSDDEGHQTDDLQRDREGWFDGGRWYDEKPRD